MLPEPEYALMSTGFQGSKLPVRRIPGARERVVLAPLQLHLPRLHRPLLHLAAPHIPGALDQALQGSQHIVPEVS